MERMGGKIGCRTEIDHRIGCKVGGKRDIHTAKSEIERLKTDVHRI